MAQRTVAAGRAVAAVGAALLCAGAGLAAAPAAAAAPGGWTPPVPVGHRVDAWKVAPLAKACRTGRVICADKTSRTLRWVVDGKVKLHMDARFGAPGMDTDEGTFAVSLKSKDHISSLYGSPMPFAMFFNGNEAVHYSPDFARRGFTGGSHGCVNVRDEAQVKKLFANVKVGDRVVVYRS
jgi:lipoprotein-anchoring transpeptidase ErfK/SrfK